MKVSIIIPYNVSRGYLGQAVSAAEHQEGMILNKDYEVIVQHGDCGVSENINRALDKSRGDFIKLCAEDDMVAPGCLSALYKFAIEGGYDFVCADAFDFYGNKVIIAHRKSIIPETVSRLAEGNQIHGGTILYRRAAMPYFDTTHWTGEEYAVPLKMAAAGAKFGKLDDTVFWYRVHGQQKSIKDKTIDGDTILKRYRFIRDVIQLPYVNNSFRIVR